MSINVTGAARVSSVSTVDATEMNLASASQAARAEPASISKASISGDGLKAPVPLRFPWLSRLSSELEPVARQKPPFATLPITGDNVDQAV